MFQKTTVQLTKLRHIYHLLHRIQTNGFDESHWRKILLHGLEKCFAVKQVWSGIICNRKVTSESKGFDRLAMACPSHDLVQMCDQFENRWAREVEQQSFDIQDVLSWISQAIANHSDVWYCSKQFRLEHINIQGRQVVLLSYCLNTVQMRCFMFEREVIIPQDMLSKQIRHDKRLAGLLMIEMFRMIRHTQLVCDCYLLQPLSPREIQTAQYLLQEYSEKEFASLMHLSPHTIHTYVKSIYRQFGVSSRAEFTSFFIRHVPKHHYFQLSSKMALSEDHSKPVYIQS